MPVMRSRITLVVLTLFALAPRAWAENSASAADPELPAGPRIAVLLLAAGDAPADLSANLTEVLVAVIASQEQARIIGSEEFLTMLAREGNEALSCLESIPCLGRVAVQLNVQQVIAGSVGLRPGGYAFHLTRTDVTTGRVEGRVFREVEGEVGALIAAIRESALRLLEETVEPGSLRLECEVEGAAVHLDDEFIGNAPINRGDVTPGTHTLRVEADEHRTWRGEVEISPGLRSLVQVALEPQPRGTPVNRGVATGAWLLVGLGLASLGTAGALGMASQQELPDDITRVEALDELTLRDDYALSANILFALGGSLLVAGVLWLIFDRQRAFGTSPVSTDTTTGWSPGGMTWAW